ncbi:aspartate--tRNA ligase msd1 [Geranomyces michiganensis]|nr:aspartate--tRNA ligase msd1 [Geranomyces michiganensis]
MLALAVRRTAVATSLRTTRALASVAVPAIGALRTKYTLPDLPYDYNALEPYISAEIMQLHHAKHHQTYVTGINTAEEKLDDAISKKDLREAISLQHLIKFNGGGHINHSLFWTNLAPQKQGGGEPPKGALANAINSQFGSLDEFQKKFSAQTAAVQGSGWGWLGYNKETKKLEIVTTANQDPLLSHVPLLGIDVWEHAYYLQYKNVRPDYLKAIWSVVNWKNVAERHAAVA